MESPDDHYGRRLVEETSKLRVELAGVEVRLADRTAQVESALRDRIAQSESLLRQEIGGVEVRLERRIGDLLKWSFVFWIGQVVAMTAIMSVLLR